MKAFLFFSFSLVEPPLASQGLPLQQRLLLLLTGGPFSFFILLWKRSHFFFFLVPWVCFCMYKHVEDLPQARHSTAQHNQPCTKQGIKYVPIRARQRKQKQTELVRASMSSSIYAARRVLETNQEIEISHENIQPLAKQLLAGVMRE